MKEDLGYDLTNDWGSLGGLRDVLVHVGCEPRASRVPPPLPPIWNSAGIDLVATFAQCTAIRTSWVVRPAWTCLDPNTFHNWKLRVSLVD